MKLGSCSVTDQPVNTVRIDLSKDKWDIIHLGCFSMEYGFDGCWTAAVNSYRGRNSEN